MKNYINNLLWRLAKIGLVILWFLAFILIPITMLIWLLTGLNILDWIKDTADNID